MGVGGRLLSFESDPDEWNVLILCKCPAWWTTSMDSNVFRCWSFYKLLCGCQEKSKCTYKVTSGDVIHRATEYSSKESLLPVSALCSWCPSAGLRKAHQPRLTVTMLTRSFPRSFFPKRSLFSWILYKAKWSKFSFQISLWSLVNGMRILTSQERHFFVIYIYISIKTTKLPKSKETISFFIWYLRNNFYVKVVCFHKV